MRLHTQTTHAEDRKHSKHTTQIFTHTAVTHTVIHRRTLRCIYTALKDCYAILCFSILDIVSVISSLHHLISSMSSFPSILISSLHHLIFSSSLPPSTSSSTLLPNTPGFAGPAVILNTMCEADQTKFDKQCPADFQCAQYVLDHGTLQGTDSRHILSLRGIQGSEG
jgi:hypothetical protein